MVHMVNERLLIRMVMDHTWDDLALVLMVVVVIVGMLALNIVHEFLKMMLDRKIFYLFLVLEIIIQFFNPILLFVF